MNMNYCFVRSDELEEGESILMFGEYATIKRLFFLDDGLVGIVVKVDRKWYPFIAEGSEQQQVYAGI